MSRTEKWWAVTDDQGAVIINEDDHALIFGSRQAARRVASEDKYVYDSVLRVEEVQIT